MRRIIFSSLLALFFLAGCSVSPNVSVLQMMEKARFETYTFSANPPWTAESRITDINFLGGHTFTSAFCADDGRHVVLTQSKTYRKNLGPKIRTGQLIYTSPNGFNTWVGGPKKCYCATVLRSARSFIRYPPADDCMGYALESPTGAVLLLAVNGTLADEELYSLIDSLISTEEFQQE
jgi:hypothetical protein